MRVALGLALYSAIVLAVGPRLLVRSTATGRAPRLGILAWQVACWSVVGSWMLAGLTMAAPSVIPSDGVSGLLHACLSAVRQAVSAPRSTWLRLVGIGVVVAVGARSVSCLLYGLWNDHRRRARHMAMVTMVGRSQREIGALVLDRSEPVVYCLPGRGGRVVATTGALRRLTTAQLQAVLAHERAHLRGRHHLTLGAAQSLARAFPKISLFAVAAADTARLVEMRADDAAARRCGPRHVAEALVALADASAPTMALAATGVRTVQRVERLLADREPSARASGILLALVAVFVTGPVVSAAAPVLSGVLRHWGLCPLPA